MNLATQDIDQAYADLDLKPGASWEEVKAAYRRLARALHPDLNPGAAGGLMGRVNQAYNTLSRHLEDSRPQAPAGQGSGGNARRAGGESWARRAARAAQAGVRDYAFRDFAGEAADADDTRRATDRTEAHRQAREQEQRRRAAARRRAAQRFHQEARQAAEAALRRAPRAMGPMEPDPAPADRSQTVAAPPQPAAGRERTESRGWRLTGLSREGQGLVYQVEVSGQPQSLDLPVRRLEACPRCNGTGRLHGAHGAWTACPDCAGKGRITKPSRVRVDLPQGWVPGQRIAAQPGMGIQVELMAAAQPGGEV